MYDTYGTPDMPVNAKVLIQETQELRQYPLRLNRAQRKLVEAPIRKVCEHGGYTLLAVNVRTNHVHSVASARCKPEHVMDSFKSYATRKLRANGLLSWGVSPWARHGSTRWLRTEAQIARALDYVMNRQGDEPFR